MSLTPEEIAELQARAAMVDELEARLNALDGKKGEILDEKKQLQQQLRELQDKEEARKKKELEDQGRTAELLEQERKEKEALRKELEEKDKAIEEERQQRIKDRTRADVMSVFNSAEVFQTDHFYGLVRSAVTDEEGTTKMVFKGQKMTPAQARDAMRQDPEWAYLFRPSKSTAGGMGARPASGGQGATPGNPYLPGGSLAQRIEVEIADPDLAAKLKAEAGASARGQG